MDTFKEHCFQVLEALDYLSGFALAYYMKLQAHKHTFCSIIHHHNFVSFISLRNVRRHELTGFLRVGITGCYKWSVKVQQNNVAQRRNV